MQINPLIKNILLEQIWEKLQIGTTDAENVISSMIKENYFKDNLQNESEISSFINSTLNMYLYPCNLNRLKVYDKKFLDENDIILSFIMIIPDGWDCNLYFDKKNNLYWEDNYGRYSKEGFKISPYVNSKLFYTAK